MLGWIDNYSCRGQSVICITFPFFAKQVVSLRMYVQEMKKNILTKEFALMFLVGKISITKRMKYLS